MIPFHLTHFKHVFKPLITFQASLFALTAWFKIQSDEPLGHLTVQIPKETRTACRLKVACGTQNPTGTKKGHLQKHKIFRNIFFIFISQWKGVKSALDKNNKALISYETDLVSDNPWDGGIYR